MAALDPVERIAALRQEIARLDRQILSLVSDRMRVAQEIGECKRQADLPVRDFRAEVEVLERTRRACESLQLDPDVGTALQSVLIEAAVRTQNDHRDRGGREGSRKSVLVVGGCGRMGNWLCEFFAAQGHQVSVCDPQQAEDSPYGRAAELATAVKQAEVIVLATPIGATANVLRQVVEAGPRGLVFDILSLKSPILDEVRAAAVKGVRISSVHPMFAPGPVLLSGRVLVVCDCGNVEAAEEARHLFDDTALRIVSLPLEEHDRLMGYVLGASHAVNLAFARAVAASGMSILELDRVASTTFSKQMKTTREVAYENPQLYYEIQHLNAHTPAVLEALVDAMQSVRAAALSDEAAAFCELMASNRNWFEAPG